MLSRANTVEGEKIEPVAAVVPQNFPRWQNTLIYCMFTIRVFMNGVLPNEWFDAFSSIRWRSCDGFGEHSDSLTKVAWKHLVLWHSSAIRKAVSEPAAEFLMGQLLDGMHQTMLRPDLDL